MKRLELIVMHWMLPAFVVVLAVMLVMAGSMWVDDQMRSDAPKDYTSRLRRQYLDAYCMAQLTGAHGIVLTDRHCSKWSKKFERRFGNQADACLWANAEFPHSSMLAMCMAIVDSEGYFE